MSTNAMLKLKILKRDTVTVHQ